MLSNLNICNWCNMMDFRRNPLTRITDYILSGLQTHSGCIYFLSAVMGARSLQFSWSLALQRCTPRMPACVQPAVHDSVTMYTVQV